MNIFDEVPGALPTLDIVQLRSGLKKLWVEDGHRIVFWFDSDAEFEDALPLLGLESDLGVQVARLDEESALDLKWRLEREDTESRFLLYTPTTPPEPENDWLLDIRLYSATFRADRASIWLDELGLGETPSLRAHLTERRRFLLSRERVSKLAALVTRSDSAADLDRKMLAVTLGCDVADPLTLGAALGAHLHGSGGLSATPKAWSDAGKFGLQAAWWEVVGDVWGYREETPTLRNWMLRLLVSDLAHGARTVLLPRVRNLLLPPSYWQNVAVFLSQWRDSVTRTAAYDGLALEAARVLDIEPVLRALDLDALERCSTFQEVEKALIMAWRDLLVTQRETIDLSQLQSVVGSRLQGHFAGIGRPSSSDVPRAAYIAAYGALGAAAELLVLVAQTRDGFGFGEAADAYARYEQGLFRADQLYRHFCEGAATVRAQGWDLLKSLSVAVEEAYTNGYLARLGAEWSELVEAQLLPEWKIDGVPLQSRFWENTVVEMLTRPSMKSAGLKRVFVIISDGLRFEVADELGQQLRGKYRFTADLSSQMSVLPSITPLGMAALLPHQKIEARDNGEIWADGKPTGGLDNRRAILAEHGGVAVHAEDFMRMSRDAMRDFARGARAVYIYHDAIDETGDKAATEDETFAACRRAIEELGALASAVINKANGNTLFITADHGFLFTESAPSATEKSRLDFRPPGTVVAKKRFLWGANLGTDAGVHAGSLEKTARVQNEEQPGEFWVPRSINRFHFAGGARYFHGGAMPQEIVVPILTVREAQNEAALKTQIREVKVAILDAPRITTSRGRFELLQTELVSDRVQAATVQLGIYEGQDLVSDTQTLRFDSRSDDTKTHRKTVFLSLLPRDYNRKTPYFLVLRHQEDGREIERREVFIDRAFREDF
jgi:uncharacterized protein (TIGR02687 family)